MDRPQSIIQPALDLPVQSAPPAPPLPHRELAADVAATVLQGYDLFLEHYQVEASLGVHAHERKARQPLEIDVTVTVSAASCADALEAVLNYELLVAEIDDMVSRYHYQLQESFCRDLIGRLIAHARVEAVSVTTRKTSVYPNARAVGCRTRWRREG